MVKQKSIKVNFIMNTMLTMSSLIFPLITFPYVSRILLPDGTGRVSFATSLIAYFTMFSQLGIPTYGIKMCASVRDNKKELTRVAHELLTLNIIMSMLSYIVLFFMIFTVPRLQEDRILYMIVSLSIIFTAIGMEWLYKALEQYTYITIRSIIFKFIALAAMFFLIHKQSDYIVYGAISIFAASASNFLNLINVHKYIGIKPIGGYNFKRHIKPISVFFAMSCATTVYSNLDTVMLGFMKSETEVGYYNAATKIKGILVSIVTSLGTVLLPRASYYVKTGHIEEFQRITKKAINFVHIVSIPLAVYFILFAEQGVRLLSGSAYVGAVLPMQIIMPTVFFIGLSNITGIQILVPMGKERKVLISVVIGAITDLVLNYFLIPELGVAGAAIGTLIAEVVVLLYQCICLRDIVLEAMMKLQYFKLMIAVVGAMIVGTTISQIQLPDFWMIIISGILFFGVYFIMLLVMKESLIKELFYQFLQLIKNIRKKGKNE